jgi:hypothetical protein
LISSSSSLMPLLMIRSPLFRACRYFIFMHAPCQRALERRAPLFYASALLAPR